MKDQIDLIYIFVGLFGLLGWFLLGKLYPRYRDLQIRLGMLTEKQKAQPEYEGLFETIFSIIMEKRAEVRKNLIIIPERFKK